MRGTMKQRSEGSWSLIIDLPRERGEKRKQKWVTFKGSKRAAQVELARLIGEIDDGSFQASGRCDGKGGLSPRTVHHMHRILKQALGQAVKWGLLKRNVAMPLIHRASKNAR